MSDPTSEEKKLMDELDRADEEKLNAIGDIYVRSSIPQESLFAVLDEVARELWSGRLDECDELLHQQMVKSDPDLSLVIASSEVALWRFNLSAVTEENEQEVFRRLHIVETMAVSAYSRLTKKQSQSFLAWLAGQDCVPIGKWVEIEMTDEEVGESNESESIARAVIECAGALCFVPLCVAAMSFRSGQKMDMIRGAYNLRKAWKALENASRLLRHYEARKIQVHAKLSALIRLGTAFFHFFMSLVPSSFSWLVQLVGFPKANRSLALRELDDVVKSKTTKWREASILLVAIKQFFLDEKDEAASIVEKLLQELPKSPLMLSFKADGKTDEAVEMYTMAVEHSSELSQMECTLRYNRGTCFYLQNDWKQAREDLQYFIDRTTGRQFLPYAAFMLGFCHWKIGSHEQIEPLFKRVPSWVRPNQSYDAYASRKTNVWLATKKFSEFDEIFLSAYALHHGQYWKRAIQELEKAVPLLKASKREENRDDHGQFYWLKGSCLKGLKKYEKAVPFLQKAVDQYTLLVNEKWIVPYAIFELGEIEGELGKFNEAELKFKQALSFSNYDWEKILNARIKSSQEKYLRRATVAAMNAE